LTKRWLFFFLFLHSASLLFSQANAFTFYSVNEGLAQSTVMDIYKDPSGLLWAGTGEGLSLWNGHSFRNVQHHYDDPKGLSNNTVRHILPDAYRHCVWIGTESGLDCFNESGVQLDNYIFPGWVANEHIPLFSNDTALWVFISGKGIYRLNTRTKKIVLIYKDITHYFKKVIPGTDLLCYQNPKGKWVRFHLLTGKCIIEDLPFEGNISVMEIIPWQNGFLLATSRGIWSLDKEATNFKRVTIASPLLNSEDNFISVAKDSTGRIWFSVLGKGLFTCNESLSGVRPQLWQQNGDNIKNRLLAVRKIICDAYNVLWMATDGEGIIRYTGNRMFFGSQFNEPLVTDSVRWFTKCFYPEEHAMWIGTYDAGLRYVDYSTGTIKTYRSSSFSTIYSIAKGANDALLVGTENALYEFSGEKFIPYTLTTSLKEFSFHNILRLHNGRCLVATNSWLMLADESRRTLSPVGDSAANIAGMIELNDGTVLCAAMYRGLYFYSAELKLTKQIFYESLGIPAATTITAFVPDDANGMWAASNIGLLHFDAAFHLKEIFTNKAGLPGNMLYAITKLPSGELFITTGNGISIMDPHHKSFRNFNTSDGLRSNECNTRALAFSADNYLYIGSINGFVRKHFPFEENNSQPAPVCFSENIMVNDELLNNVPQELPFNKNSLTFNLYLSDFAFSESGAWSYRVDGLDTHLVNIPFGMQFRLLSLPPGMYTMHIFRAGQMKTEFRSLVFTIHPPWWQTTWFRVLFVFAMFLLAAGIVYFIINYRYRIKLRRLESLRLIEKIRTRISSDIHDDLGAGLTRIALTSDLISMQVNADVQLSKKVGHMAEVARDLSQSLKEVVWSVKPEYDNLPSMVNYFKAYCGEFFEDSDATFSFRSTGTLHSIPVLPETRRNLFLILKEACNNAMKHAAASKIEAIFEYQQGRIKLEIKDNGKGFSNKEAQDMLNTSGIKNMERRAKGIGFHFKLEQNEAGGCSVIVTGLLSEKN
jgi:signal transduction histidine kinase/ligand-binding sensor domain-containing protein